MKTLLRCCLLLSCMFGISAFSDTLTSDTQTPNSQIAKTQTSPLRVLEKGTGMPVQGATVVNLQTDAYATSDAKGQVVLNGIAQGSKVKVLAPGYETFEGKLKLIKGALKIYLVPVSVEGEGMEVVADRLPDKISKISLSAKELAKTPGSEGDPIMAAKSLPGIVAVNDGGGRVYMRGSDSSDNMTVVNDLPIGYLYHMGGLRSTINPQLISDLNIFLGGFPVTYGDSLGGVFDIRLRDPSNARQRYFFDISTIESSFVAEGPTSPALPRDSYYLAARRSYIDLLFSPSKFSDLTSNSDKPADEQNQFITVPRYYDAQGIYHHPTDTGSFDYYYFAAGDELAFLKRSGTKADPQSAGELQTKVGFQTFGINWKTNVDARWHWDMPIAFYDSKQRLQYGTDPSGNHFYINTTQYNLVALPKLTWKYNLHDEINFGMQASYRRVPLDVYFARPPVGDQNPDYQITDLTKYRVKATINARNISPYIQQRKHWTKKLSTILGLRYSYVGGTGGIHLSGTSPRLAVEYQATPKTLYTASWGKYLQAPEGFELLQGYGNPSLAYTEAEHRIIGVEHKINSLWSIKTEAYDKPMKDLIIAIDSQDPPNNYDNIGKGHAYGVDVYLKREARDGRMGWLSYSYGRSTRYNPLKPEDGYRDFSGDQPHTLTYVWSQPFTDGPFGWMKNWKRWTWGIKLQAHSGKLYTPIIGRTQDPNPNPGGSIRYIPIYASQNSKRTPPYFRMDVRLERDILRNESKMKFYIEILNATNHNNITGYDYGDQYQHINDPTELTGMPLFPYIGFETEF